MYGDRQYEIRLMDEYPFLMVMPAIIVSNVCLISGRVLSPAAWLGVESLVRIHVGVELPTAKA